MFQALEGRRFLSGAVNAGIHHGTLVIDGDDAANVILVERAGTDPTSIQITPLNNTTINGAARPAVFAGVDRGITADLGDGNDAMTLSGLRIFGAVKIKGGDGNDSLLVRSSRTSGTLRWLGGSGDDSILVRNTIIQRNLSFDGGEGHDRFGLAADHVREDFYLGDTSGASSVNLQRLSVDKLASVRTGNSIDHVNVADSTFKSAASFSLTGGDDQIKVRGTVFHGASPINGGTGSNVIDREVILSWDFRDGLKGWTAGFADYPAGYVESSNGKTAEETYELQSGLKPLPKELGIPGTGAFLSGANHSDALSMYFMRRISQSDGLLAGARYAATFIVKLASNVPSGLAGVGGDPNIGVWAGADPRKPKLVVSKGYETQTIKNYSLNIADAAVPIGHIENGGPAVLNDIYRVITRKKIDAETVVADRKGQMSILAGNFHSGFEGRTSLYYMSVAVTLTPITE